MSACMARGAAPCRDMLRVHSNMRILRQTDALTLGEFMEMLLQFVIQRQIVVSQRAF